MRRLTWALLPFCAAVFLAVILVPDSWHVTAGIACLLLSAAALFCQGRVRTKVLLTTVSLSLGFFWCGVYQASVRAGRRHALEKTCHFPPGCSVTRRR